MEGNREDILREIATKLQAVLEIDCKILSIEPVSLQPIMIEML